MAGIDGLAALVVLIGGIIISALLGATVVLTVGYSFLQYVKRRRRDGVRDRLENEMLDRLYATNSPEWQSWVDGLTTVERDVVESLLDQYLRSLKGQPASHLRDLGDSLGLPNRVQVRLKSSNQYTRLRALTWCTLLRYVPEAIQDGSYTPRSAREAAVLARLLYVVDDANLEQAVDLLLTADPADSYSVFGLDTLYFVSKDNPTPFLSRGATAAPSWSPLVYAQALLVARHLPSMVSPEDPVEWLARGLDQPAVRTRVEAANALANYGWHDGVRSEIDVESMYGDSSPVVRASIYEMLGAWGDEVAREHLQIALQTESNDRALVAGGRALTALGVRPTESSLPDRVHQAINWVQEHKRYDSLAKRDAGTAMSDQSSGRNS